MTDPSCQGQGQAQIFKFEGRTYMPLLLLLAGGGLLMFFGYFGFMRYGLCLGYSISMATAILVIASTLYFRITGQYADLVIEDQRVSKTLLNVTLKQMNWSTIKQIRVASVSLPGDSKPSWVIHLYPYDRSLRWRPTKPAMMLSDRTEDKVALAGILNTYAERYGIKLFQKKRQPGQNRVWIEIPGLDFS